MFILFIVILFLIIIFIPFPVKLHIFYNNKKLNLYFFNINILNKITSNKKEFNINSANSIKQLATTIKKSRMVFKRLLKIKYKPKINIDIDIVYGLDDAAYTAILYGLINSLTHSLLIILSRLFILKKQKINIKPCFNKSYFKLEINSIIYVSFVKIIYIILSLYIDNKSLKKLRTSVNKI
ncbi:DUF2953 domain-containing protein [Clostridium tyrobutyricum]|uniref:DUF2953 domain-containing protein n=2 Tax=Clostridium tyrobutyricum TaxID=1519 RepID=W6N8B1_CLOTY|nr:DUF2953 domain-containing protein [Clostridium tyrobutyricum]CDL92645.1 hypothetical protein CTDIVETGP_2715 [Clostridium tyrobutyricum DIVETGP]AND84560.1 hypothetical protein CTK_C12990 [Clostridium tyrobutyricum]ANP69170.1 hypothetical protein BA182_05620 [Clostridium tyrobutyricum]MBR9648991.1 DUF2953 domain-containing protein [Clostridium tyrobutyricum]MBV4415547.1 DUF2953 domain-containing protein [Clostridium tyrobutyricum]